MLLDPYRFGHPLTLVDNLVAYWKMDEVSGNALDSHGVENLTDVNTVGSSAAGKIARARDFDAASIESFTRTSANLTTGDIDFTLALWIKGETLGAQAIFQKWPVPGSLREFMLMRNAAHSLDFSVIGPGGAATASSAVSLVAGVWYHVVCWHDSNLDQIGISVDTVVDSTVGIVAFVGGPVAYPTAPFVIGEQAGNTFPWNGLIDEVGFWKRVLTPAERATLYNSGNGLAYSFGTGYVPSPVAEFSGTPLTGSLPRAVTFTDASTKSPTSWSWAKNNGSGWVPFAGTPTAQHPTETFAPGTWDIRLTATNTGGSDDEVRIGYVIDVPLPSPLLTNLISYWKLDEASGNALDVHSTNHLTPNGTVGTAAGKVGTARDFVPNSWLSRTSGADLSTGDIDFTISLWMRSRIATNSKGICSKYDGSTYEIVLYCPSGGELNWVVNSGSATAGGLVPVANTWYHIVCWHDAVNNVVGMSVNNGAANTASYAGGLTARPTAPFLLGGFGANNAMWDGQIDEVGFWKRMLTPAERTELYNSGNGKTYPFT